MNGRLPADANIDLGLAISAATLQPGEQRSTYELAAYCGCTHQNITRIEQRALRKLRIRLRFHKDPILREAVQTLFKR